MTTDDPDDTPTQFGMDDTMPGGEDRTMPSQPAQDPADRTLPSQPVEDRTVPSQPVEDRTLPTQPAQAKTPPKTPPKTAPQPAKPTAPAKPAAADADDKTAPAMKREAPRDVHGGLIGKTLGGCRIDKLLGKGAMGAVYKAVQIKLDRHVAVKVIRPEMMTDPRMLKRFEVEARTVGKFNSANVVMVHDVGFEQGVHYLVMEFVQGKNLREHVKLLVGGRLPVGDALPLIRQACAGLNEARRLGVVHRDIKPDNLMLTDQGVLKIADFGIAKPVEQDFSMTLTSELIGTPLYMSPEQCQGGAAIDFRSDMYSLGATFFYLLTGEPPIRASSVYELIQTKTKLENLCLWKALPELAENNPLSRVIERMTANDRDDRYESYEELVNDLVLVQEGGTITLPAKKPKKPEQKRLEPAKKGKGALLAVAALLAVGGGGGYWWWQQQQGQPQQQKPVVIVDGPGQPTPEDGRKALAQFRNRLRETGPSSSLRDEIVSRPMAADLTADRELLLAEVDAGLALDQRIAEVIAKRPKELALPFTDIRDYYTAIRDAAVVDAATGEAVRTWLLRRIDEARDENNLAADGRSLLSTTFLQWSGDRSRAGGDDESLAALRARLETISAGRSALATLFPTRLDALDRALPEDRLRDAFGGLDKGLDVMPDSDVEAALDEASAQLREQGPLPSVQDKVDKLRAKREDLIARRAALLNEIGKAEQCKVAAQRHAVPEPVAPFRNVRDSYQAVERELRPLADAAGELPPWAKRLSDDLTKSAATQTRCVEVCQRMLEELQTAAERQPYAAIEARQKDLAAAIAGALELFPAAASEFEPLQQAAAAVMAGAAAKQRQEQLLTGIAGVATMLDGVRSLEDWLRKSRGIDDQLAQLRSEIGEDASNDVRAALGGVEAASKPWREVVVLVDKAGTLFGEGRLKDCLNELAAGVSGNAGRDELDELNRVAQGCQDLFRDLDATLDVEAAQQQLRVVKRRADGATWLPKAIVRKLATWDDGLRQLRTETERMVPIPGGRVGKPPQDVPSFFLGATEVTGAEFAAWVNSVKVAAGAGDRQARYDAVAARIAGSDMDAQSLARLLERPPSAGSLPVDHVTWHEAMAYAAWYGMQLPTPAQWELAAFGDGNRYTYPWGNDYPPSKPESLHTGDRLTEASVGGVSWRNGSVVLHHLAGNVAEWLRCDPTERKAPIAGGRARDPDLRVHAGGEFVKVSKDDAGVSFIGFRVLLEPHAFKPLAWPR
ncbi:MAG: bifunctional serine/threonine-protein kinase/formylglycine-generating enzyme family protein [Planctomycetota bacterium]